MLYGLTSDKLQKLQNRALRICLNTGPRNSRNTLHVQAEIPLLEFRRISHLRNYMYKRKENPVYIENAQVNTRRHDAVMVKSVKANYTLVERSESKEYPYVWEIQSISETVA